MYKRILIGLLLLVSFSYLGNSQDKFRNPVKYPIKLTGSFGELRKNHFHTGIDIKSSGNYKLNKVYSVKNGYISRIKISSGGYGNALYINHPDGTTSVYAHLEKFSKKISEIAKRIQIENESFEINPDTLYIPVSKGEYIGQIGNTGRSFGPHLHFELRNTLTEHPLNPFIYGIKPKDTKPPELLKLKIVALDTSYNVLNSAIYPLKKTKYGNYIPQPFTINYGAWRVGIEVLGFDRMNGTHNKNGIYKLSAYIDDKLIYGFVMDSLDFDKMKDINAFIDFKEYSESGKKYIRLYKLPGMDLDIFSENNSGIVNLFANKKQKVEIVAEDYNGNKSKVIFNLKRDNNIYPGEAKLYNFYIDFNEEKRIVNGNVSLLFEKEDLFKNMYLLLTNNIDTTNVYSDNIGVFTNYEPFKNNIDIQVIPMSLDTFLEKMCIVKTEKNKIINYGGKFEDGQLHTLIDSWGTYFITLDTIKPVIKPLKFFTKKRNTKSISFKIWDNFETAGLAKEMVYKGYIDGKWVLFEYDKKKKKITHKFEKTLNQGKHRLKLIVEDDRGNKNIFESNFIK
ncbi:MAG TPA: M23 family metallopeptidase [Bacteroidetes bacterium]|nr:M23 family metallopeptidase [Bacteroidota bacterium]